MTGADEQRVQLECSQLGQARHEVADDSQADGIARVVGDGVAFGHGQQLASSAGAGCRFVSVKLLAEAPGNMRSFLLLLD